MLGMRQNGVSVAGTDRNGEIHDMLHVDDFFVSPLVLEDIFEDLDGLVPDKSIVPLHQRKICPPNEAGSSISRMVGTHL